MSNTVALGSEAQSTTSMRPPAEALTEGPAIHQHQLALVQALEVLDQVPEVQAVEIQPENLTRNHHESKRRSVNPDDILSVYYEEIGRTPLLTKAGEQSLGKSIQEGQRAADELAAAEKGAIPLRARKKLNALVDFGDEAQAALVRANLRLVVKVAKRYTSSGVPLADLIQDGNAGLMVAAKKFDYQKGFKFSTYSVWWIRQQITRHLPEQTGNMRMPYNLQSTISRVIKLEEKVNSDGTYYSDEQVAEEAGITVDELLDIRVWRMQEEMFRLDSPFLDSDDTRQSTVHDRSAPTVENRVLDSLASDGIQELFSSVLPKILTADELRALRVRLAKEAEQDSTVISEIADGQGASSLTVNHAKAKAKLKHPFLAQELDRLGVLMPADRWKLRAKCLGVDVATIFPIVRKGESPELRHSQRFIISQACEVCPVRDECGATAQTSRTPQGVWGGQIYMSKGKPL